MALIVKIDAPLAVSDDGRARIHARPYKEGRVQTGDEVFVWAVKRNGGYDLAARGSVAESRVDSVANAGGSGVHRELVVDLQIVSAAPTRRLSLEELALGTDGDAAPPAASGKALYHHALNKINTVDSDVADFIRSHFGDV